MSDQGASIIYLLLLLGFVGTAVMTRNSLSKNVHYMVIWAGIFLVVIVGARIYDKNQLRPHEISNSEYNLRIPYSEYNQGYVTYFDVNGAEIQGVIDTGASQLVLTYQDARHAGINPDNLSFSSEVSTANGTTMTASTVAERVSFGEHVLENVPTLVAQEGDLDGSLIGMSVLRRFKSFSANGDNFLIAF